MKWIVQPCAGSSRWDEIPHSAAIVRKCCFTKPLKQGKLSLMGEIRMLLLLVALFGFQPAYAGDRATHVPVGGALGFNFQAPWADDTASNAADPGFRGSLWTRYHHDSMSSGWELAYDYLTTGKMPFRAHAFSAAFFWRHDVSSRLHPLWAFGTGYAVTEKFFNGPDRDMGFVKFRAGVDYELNSRLDLGAYVDYFFFPKDLPNEANLHFLMPTVGLTLYFGDPNPTVAATAPAAPGVSEPAKQEAKPVANSEDKTAHPVEADSDGDGVLDKNDRCAKTTFGVAVDAKGCPLKTKKSAKPAKKSTKKR